MGMFDNLFGGRDTNTAPLTPAALPGNGLQQQQPQPGQTIPATGLDNVLNNLNLPGTNNPSAAPAQPQDDLAKLWEPVLDKDGNPIESSNPALGSGINFNLDMNKLDQHFATVDFTKGVNPELFQHIAAGGDQAIAALPQLINHAVRQAVLTSAQSTAKLVQGTVTNADQNIASLVQAEVKKLGLQDTIKQNPIYSNPMYAPIVDTVQRQVLQKYPNATHADLANAVDTYFKRLGSDLNPNTGNQPFNINNHNTRIDTGGTDWTAYWTSDK